MKKLIVLITSLLIVYPLALTHGQENKKGEAGVKKNQEAEVVEQGKKEADGKEDLRVKEFGKQRAVAAKAAAENKRKEAELKIKEQEAIISASEAKVRATEESVNFQKESGQITEQEAAEKNELLDKAKKKIEAMKKVVEKEKTALEQLIMVEKKEKPITENS